jgi:hypothetical protein
VWPDWANFRRLGDCLTWLPEFSLFNVPKRGKPGAIVGANPTVFEFTATTPAL